MAGESHGKLPVPKLEPQPHVLIVCAPYYRDVADWLLAGARRAIEAAGGTHETVEVPGALEIPTAIRIASQSYRHHGFVALGCVIRGETTHYDIVAGESSRALTDLGLQGLCIGNGILTVETHEQARVRAAELDKGGGAAEAALHLIALARRFRPGGRGQRPEGPHISLSEETNADGETA